MLDFISLKGQKEIHSNGCSQETSNRYDDYLSLNLQSSVGLNSDLTYSSFFSEHPNISGVGWSFGTNDDDIASAA